MVNIQVLKLLQLLVQNKVFKIAILGKDNFGVYIDALSNKKCMEMPIQIERINNLSEIDDEYRIIFISKDKKDSLPKIIKELKYRPILLISDIDNFINFGGTLWLKTEDKRLKIIINLLNAKKADIKFSSKLLEVANKS